jgi:PAS domain-containing protein
MTLPLSASRAVPGGTFLRKAAGLILRGHEGSSACRLASHDISHQIGAIPADFTALDALATPILWCDGAGRVPGGNLAFARWLGVGPRRLPGMPLAAFEAEDQRLARVLTEPAVGDQIRLRRLPFGFPGSDTRLYADALLSRREDGGWWPENNRLKRLLVETHLDIEAMKIGFGVKR